MTEQNLARTLASQSIPPKPAKANRPTIKKVQKAIPIIGKKQIALSMLFIAYVLAVCVGLLTLRITITEQNKQMIEAQKTLDEVTMEYTRLNLATEQLSTLKTIETIASEEYGMVKADKSQINYIQIQQINKIEIATQKSIWSNPFGNIFSTIKEYFVG